MARTREALGNTNNLLKLYENLHRYQRSVNEINAEIATVRAAIASEMGAMSHAQQMVKEIEETFLTILRRVGVPGVGHSERVRMDPTNWIPWVTNDAAPEDEWDYIQASSGGRRVLFVVCYAIALHIVAERNNLPLPTLLMIDTPVKNVERDINRELVQKMQEVIFLVADRFKLTQVILANGTFETFPFTIEPIRIELTRERGLIPYYREGGANQ